MSALDDAFDDLLVQKVKSMDAEAGARLAFITGALTVVSMVSKCGKDALNSGGVGLFASRVAQLMESINRDAEASLGQDIAIPDNARMQ